MPGDTLIGGAKLQNRLTRGDPSRIGLYTSPSIKYSELDLYTKPIEWQGNTVRVVLQCRQEPGSFNATGETVGWLKRWGKTPISKHFANDEIERFSHARGSIMPYRVLVSLDVKTREKEQEDEARVARLQLAEQLLHNKKQAAEKAKHAAEKAKEVAETAIEASKKANKAAEKAQQQEAEARVSLASLREALA